MSTHQVNETEQRIEKDLHKDSHDFQPVYKELTSLRAADSNNFHQDLQDINDKLHKDGYLPHMQLIENGKDGFAVVADSSNPQKAAVVSNSQNAPVESPAESQTYSNLGYNGWNTGGYSGGFNGAAVEGYVPTGDRLTLIDEALTLAGYDLKDMTPAERQQLEAMVNLIVEHESSWNPNAINLTDSNAAAGHPSQGLMQTIPGTFNEYALPGYNTNINDPLSNLVAGIRYADSRYGGLANVPGVVAVTQGLAYVGY